MSTEGSRGGDVNRPASRAEIPKLPRAICRRCGLASVHPVIVDGKCGNTVACDIRVRRNEKKAAKR